MVDKLYMDEGWRFAQRIQNVSLSNNLGNEYLVNVYDVIERFEKSINNVRGSSRGVAQEGGFIKEIWAAETLNLDEAIKGIRNPGNLNNNLYTLGSPDITLSNGQMVSSKSLATAAKTANAQAMTVFDRYQKYCIESLRRKTKNIMDIPQYLEKNGLSDSDLHRALYSNQKRLVPSDQEEAVKLYLSNKIDVLKQQNPNSKMIGVYEETRRNVSSTIEGKRGAKSLSLTKIEEMQIAAEAQKGNFRAEKHGVSLNKISAADIARASAKAGLTAAAISAAIQMVPLTFDAIDHLCKYGEIDIEKTVKRGVLVLSNASESFLLGFTSCAMYTACEVARYSTMATNLTPAAIGIASVFAVNTIRYSYMLATGQITAREMGYQLTKQLVIAGCAIAGGTIALAIVPEGTALAFAVGSIVGSLLASAAFYVGERVFMTYCIETGYTLFGLVDQNYAMPEEMIKELGIDLMDLDYYDLDYYDLDFYDLDCYTESLTKEHLIDYKIYRRGIVGFAQIGYLF